MDQRPADTNKEWFTPLAWQRPAVDPTHPLVQRLEAELAPYLRKAHLPRHPGGPFALVLMGFFYMAAFVGPLTLFLERGPPGGRPIMVATMSFLVAVMVPALGCILSGAWDLARGPLQHFAPRWYERLTE